MMRDAYYSERELEAIRRHRRIATLKARTAVKLAGVKIDPRIAAARKARAKPEQGDGR
jgi:hypothetical protein